MIDNLFPFINLDKNAKELTIQFIKYFYKYFKPSTFYDGVYDCVSIFYDGVYNSVSIFYDCVSKFIKNVI